jgi:hypothetical protein
MTLPPALLLAALVAAGCTSPSAQQDATPEPGTLQLIEHDAVLLRGWIGDQGAELEPVIPTAAPPSFSGAGAGPYRLRGLDDAGEVLFELRFGDEVLAGITGRPGHHFMLVAPVGAGGSLTLAVVELDAADGRVAVRSARWAAEALLEALASVQMTNLGGDGVNVSWDAERFELLQLRDPATGAILALDRDGEVVAAGVGSELEIALSDGVRSAAALLRAR